MTVLTIDLDTLTGPKPYTPTSTVQTVAENILWAVAGVSYAQQFSSTGVEDALGDYLQSVQESRPVPMVRQIRLHAAGLLAAGVAAAGGKLVACTQAHVDNLTMAAALTGAQIQAGPMTLAAVDGTRWLVNTPARATTLRTAMVDRIAAVNAARDTAITAFQALTPEQKRAFEFATIVWPA